MSNVRFRRETTRDRERGVGLGSCFDIWISSFDTGPSSMPNALGAIDILVLAVSLVAVIVIGLRGGGKSTTLEAYLLGDRNLPWWAILGSIVSTETSTATVLSVPGRGYGPPGMTFLQLAIGYI